MDISFFKSSEDFSLFTVFAAVAFGYLSYWFISNSPKVIARFESKYSGDELSIKRIIFQRMVGVLFLGIIPAFICFSFITSNLDAYGLNFNNFGLSAMWIGIMSAVIVPLIILSGKKPQNLAMYPQIRAKIWSKKLVFKSALTWILYLFAYEFLFRGVLLFPFIEPLGMWTAIMLNCLIYAFAHLPKGFTESVGAIPFGIVICLITIATDSIFMAFFVHIVMALTNEWRTLYLHKDMKII